jgi:hypothetical protein
MPAYEGGCHCGAVRIEASVEAPIESVVECNCSVCTKKGVLLSAVAEDDLAIVQGADAIETYRFHTKIAEHNFCRHCGIHVYTRPRNNPTRLAINVRCLDAFPAMRQSIEIIPFDGQNHPKDSAHGA